MKGETWINGKDAFTEWGVSLEDGAVSTLMTPSPIKDIVENKSRLEHGKRVIASDVKVDSRDLTLEMHLTAKDKATFLSNYSKFCADVLETGKVDIISTYQPDMEYHCTYVSCSQFSQFAFGLAKFTLKLNEYNPKDRTVTHTQLS